MCDLVFKHSSHFPSTEAEKKRYLQHQNDVNDTNYQDFVAPIVTRIFQQQPQTAIGLDFGAGPGPVIAKLLKDKGYSITLYDPFFYPEKESLHATYDFIICSEVMEHFSSPNKEFKLLRNLLKPNGKLYCMTQLLPKKENFGNWYYKNDSTHVVFYSERNLTWIKEHMDFSSLTVEGNVVVFKQ
ncbi:methyltransferase [Ulvibacter litoralis]|nr:methyltransferase [Ulvibacter litoralis]